MCHIFVFAGCFDRSRWRQRPKLIITALYSVKKIESIWLLYMMNWWAAQCCILCYNDKCEAISINHDFTIIFLGFRNGITLSPNVPTLAKVKPHTREALLEMCVYFCVLYTSIYHSFLWMVNSKWRGDSFNFLALMSLLFLYSLDLGTTRAL